MKKKSKTKRLLCIVLCAVTLLAGCDDTPSDSRPSQSELYEREFDTSKYNSCITYHIDDEISDADFEKVGGSEGQLLERFKKCFAYDNSDHPSMGYQIQSESKDRTVKIYFNNDKGVTEELLRLSAEKNLVEMREGTKPDGELVLTNEQITNAVAYAIGDKDSEAAFWGAIGLPEYARDPSSKDKSENPREVTVQLKFNYDGQKKLAAVTEKLAEKRSKMTLWVDGRNVYSAIVPEAIRSDSITISGFGNDYAAAKKLAYQLRSGYLPYKVSVTECKVSPPEVSTDSSVLAA